MNRGIFILYQFYGELLFLLPHPISGHTQLTPRGQPDLAGLEVPSGVEAIHLQLSASN